MDKRGILKHIKSLYNKIILHQYMVSSTYVSNLNRTDYLQKPAVWAITNSE